MSAYIGELMAMVNQKILNDTIRHAHYLQRYTTGEVNKIMKTLNGIDLDLRKQLLKYSKYKSFSAKRIKIMRNNVKDIIAEGQKVLQDRLNTSIKAFGVSESDFALKTVTMHIPDEILFSTAFKFTTVQPSPTQILAAVRSRPFANTTIQTLISEWSAKKKGILNNAIKQGWIEGEPIEDIVRRLYGTKKLRYTDGLLQTSRRNLRTITRTMINHTSSVSRNLTYKENKDLIKGYQWVSTLDGKTSLICISLDGKYDLYNDAVRQLQGKMPPAHPNCRSTTTPIVKSLKELGLNDKDFPASTRASMNGQVSDKETYKTWFSKQDAGFQEEVLGKGRYKLWSEGEISIDKFVSDNTSILTLAQLKDRL